MTGIAKIPFAKFRKITAKRTMTERTHHFFVTLKNRSKTLRSLDSINTFNPFVVGSTPAGPTKISKITPYESMGCFFCAAYLSP